MADVLDNPVWQALTGTQTSFALGDARSRRYRDDIAPFAAVDDDTDPAAWADLADLAGADVVAVIRPTPTIPPGWHALDVIPAAQLVDTDWPRASITPDPSITALTQADGPDALELVELTRPGPFRTNTIQLGGYLGIRDQGRLVAMAGHRMRPSTWVEVSAVCTHPEYRGQGLSRWIMAALIADLHENDQHAFLHVAHSNPARALYEKLGFVHRRDVYFLVLQKQ